MFTTCDHHRLIGGLEKSPMPHSHNKDMVSTLTDQSLNWVLSASWVPRFVSAVDFYIYRAENIAPGSPWINEYVGHAWVMPHLPRTDSYIGAVGVTAALDNLVHGSSHSNQSSRTLYWEGSVDLHIVNSLVSGMCCFVVVNLVKLSEKQTSSVLVK